jgi:hypothetical protein
MGAYHRHLGPTSLLVSENGLTVRPLGHRIRDSIEVNLVVLVSTEVSRAPTDQATS